VNGRRKSWIAQGGRRWGGKGTQAVLGHHGDVVGEPGPGAGSVWKACGLQAVGRENGRHKVDTNGQARKETATALTARAA